MKVFRKTILVLIILIFGMVTPVLATEEKTKKINFGNIKFFENVPNLFENFEKNTKSALDKLTEDVTKRNNEKSNNEEILNEEENFVEEDEIQEENTTNKSTVSLLDRLKSNSESLKGGGILSLLKERLSSIKIDIKIFDKLKKNNREEEQEIEDEEQEVEEKNTNQDLTKGTDKLINSLNKSNVKLFDGSLLERVDSFFDGFMNIIR